MEKSKWQIFLVLGCISVNTEISFLCKKNMEGEFKFHLSILWVNSVPSLKAPFQAKASTISDKAYPAKMRLDIQVLLYFPSLQY